MSVRVRYLSNMGVCIDDGENRVVIDIFSTATDANFIATSIEVKRALLLDLSPLHDVGWMIYTHNHPDHFDSETIYGYLKYRKNSKTKILLTQEAEADLWKTGYMEVYEDSVCSMKVDFGEKRTISESGYNITLYGCKHIGMGYGNTEHMAVLIEMGGKKILHIGDASPSAENFEHLGLQNEQIDFLIAPYPYLEMSQGQKIMEDYICPKKILITHMPKEDEDMFGWNQVARKKAAEQNAQGKEVILAQKVCEIFEV